LANIKAWISAFRLRTLPLALSSVGLGAFLASSEGKFDVSVCILSVLTTLFLQILSNLANDYGDSIHGADKAENGRKGPERAVQSGAISLASMKNAMILVGAFSLISGLALLYVSFQHIDLMFVGYFVLGLLAIGAAIKYTAGSNPYGYAGLGDLSVFIFFGLVGVMGSYFLYNQEFVWLNVLPAITVGLFSTAVLNVNNMRDIESDTKAGKRSIPVRIGRNAGAFYHAFLVLGGIISALVFVYFKGFSANHLLWLLGVPLTLINVRAVFAYSDPKKLDPFLKQMALSTLVFVLLLGIGINL
jgi:1,4-dihydroxy-2-naphthoate octaprenyltransferase